MGAGSCEADSAELHISIQTCSDVTEAGQNRIRRMRMRIYYYLFYQSKRNALV